MKQVLVIDDVAHVRRSVCAALKKHEVAAIAVEDFEQAKSEMASKTFDIVITDILMPQTDGLEVIDWIKGNHRHAKIVAMSGGGSLVGADEALRLAASVADAIIRKPFDHEELYKELQPFLKD